MFLKKNINRHLDKKESKDELVALEKRLTALQLQIRLNQIPVVIVFEGWGASGKGTHIARLVYPFDPRRFNVYTMGKVNEDMIMRPFLWPYWTRLPEKGRITIFDKSWHRLTLPDALDKWKIMPSELENFYYDVNAFEKQLTDDGVLIIKLFLHISMEEQFKRFRELERDTDSSWRVSDSDWRQNRNYHENLSLFEQMIEKTHTKENPWHIIESQDKNYTSVRICRTIVERVENHIKAIEKAAGKENGVQDENQQYYVSDSVLSDVTPHMIMEDDIYKTEISAYQRQMATMGNRMYLKRRAVVIVFEGWDAAGKGGCIKRLTEELDPRCYEVVPIGVPSKEDLAHHFLWRFYNKIPKDGHIAIFDRSWYGRVLVERVEKFTPVQVWQRAYKEINDMEAHLRNHGVIIIKFWLQIDRDEQLKRFTARQNDPIKNYKITDEDWRNREKWDDYEVAVEEMLAKTNTAYAPWTIVEANNKKYARRKVLHTVISALQDALR